MKNLGYLYLTPASQYFRAICRGMLISQGPQLTIGLGQPEGRPPKKMEVLALVSEAAVQGGLRDYGKNVTFSHIR